MRALPGVTYMPCLTLLLPHPSAAQGVHPMTRPAFDAQFRQVDNAGRWGA